MRLVRSPLLAGSFTLLLAFGCSSSSPSPADGTSGSTGASGSAGQANHGGASATGGGSAAAGATGNAGTSGTAAGGTVAGGNGGSATGGGGSSTGGITGSGGSGVAGASGTGGMGGSGGSGIAGSSGSGGGGGAQTGTPPGDIASAAGTPLVAAHSVTRAMFAAYNGKLFQARRPTDSKTQDINTVGAGGFVDLTALNTFCSGTTCTVTRLYDQTANGNDMSQNTVANQPTVGFWTAANGMKYPMIVSKGYQWLRNRTQVSKIPTGSNPQTEYFVVHGDNAGRAAGTNGCCYDYGNMENHIGDDGPGTMTALYFGDATDWTRGAGNGPWVMLDMENGVFAGGGPISILNAGQSSVNASDPSLKFPSPNIVTGLAKTDGKTTFEIKYGNASTGTLSTAWNGSLPTKTNPTSYIPLKQQGGISLGEGGDGSAMGTGAFSEGAIMAAQTSDATDTAIQANLTTIYK
jgi:non-reducing end alpha-L-arabinofuranosidase